MENKLYNVYLISSDSFKAIKLLGSKLTEGRKYICQRSNEKKINKLDYFIDGYEVGSERDLELSKDLK